MKKKNIILLGSPGSGKGTISERFVKENDYTIIVTGNILREEKNSGSKLGNIIKETIGTGKLVSDDVINEIVKNKIESTNPPYLFDGYPRTVPQAEFLEKFVNIDLAVYLNIKDEVVIKRILERGKTSGREDDKDITVINRRLNEFKSSTQPLFNYYKDKNNLIVINAENGIEEVYTDFINLIKES